MILEVARRFPIIRFDAAMTLARRHVQRLWFPVPGTGGAIPSRADPAGEVELAADDVLPQCIDGGEVVGVAGQRRHVGHRGVHVRRTHRMADRLALLHNGQVVGSTAGPPRPRWSRRNLASVR